MIERNKPLSTEHVGSNIVPHHRQGYKLAMIDVVDNHGFGANIIYVFKKTGKAIKMDHEQITFK